MTEEAIGDLSYFEKSAQVTIIDAIEKQLTDQPSQATRNRKPLRPNSRFEWELRVGSYRVFYNISEQKVTVTVISVGYKQGNKVYIRSQEVNL
ncbi:MAG: type II toxin-antitoxin system RelE/ParE family toxin [Gomphosphaeria aponina SAG 52.96 = DSM 107014]|uniref:Type II toxin-antitoxin system RelE/ParE family toxin n=1 Tax=Gomphosphaeria aponina SAG 52.96 = DSM 107014 TaxID=1521640 RepID=A0A941JSU8_9CHRO|nr:type II toxin-antitoxin system RelE/ParE family toxin [Gomphosphaeria aponina SAG 52.96 = DSM 107014]